MTVMCVSGLSSSDTVGAMWPDAVSMKALWLCRCEYESSAAFCCKCEACVSLMRSECRYFLVLELYECGALR